MVSDSLALFTMSWFFVLFLDKHFNNFEFIFQSARSKNAGENWFNMAAPDLTPSLKQDLKLLRMRNMLDPAHHYKTSDMNKQFPRHFHVGRVVASPSDFYSSRIPRKAQKQTLVDELLANEQLRHYQVKKYQQFQEEKAGGSHRHSRIKFKRKFKGK